MVERLATRFRALLGGRGEPAPAEDEQHDEDLGGLPGPDPEWDELLAWARESQDEPEWQAAIARAKQAAVVPAAVVPAAVVPAAMPHIRPPARSIASLGARLERLAAQIPDARRRAR